MECETDGCTAESTHYNVGKDTGSLCKEHWGDEYDRHAVETQEANAKAARRERQRLAWIQFMQGLMGNSHLKSLNDEAVRKAHAWAMDMYNERWETDA